MRIEFEREEFSGTLQKIASVIERKSTMPILGNVLLEALADRLAVWATDLEIGVRAECPVKVGQEGRVCVPARSLVEIVRELPEKSGRLQKGENEWLVLESGKAHFRMVGMPAEEFPQMLAPSSFSFTRINSETLRKALDKTAFAISTDEMRYNLNGAHVELGKGEKGAQTLKVVTTDGHRLAFFNQPLQEKEAVTLRKGIILPRKGVSELRRLLTEAADEQAEICVSDSNAAFRFDGTLIYMRLVVGEFPDYHAVIPKSAKRKLMVNRDLFAASLRRVSLLSEGRSRCVRLSLSKEGVHLAANSPELGEAEEQIRAELEGEPIQIGFNAKYLLEAVSVLAGEKVLFELDHEQAPGVLRSPDDPTAFNVIMPMRI